MESCAVTWYNQEKLILFVVSKDDLVKDDIFKELQKHLPNHAVPDELVEIDSLPFTSHGKIIEAAMFWWQMKLIVVITSLKATQIHII